MDQIVIRGARTHNLKDINLTIPRDKFVVITGLSGSGKSSLAFDTLYAEGQRRYVESLSAYARQFLSMMEKPDIDHIEGLSPAISIEQKSTSHNPRSTVGTITEIYDYLRLLFARVGEPFCPEHNLKLEAQTISQMVDKVMTLSIGTRIMVLAPIVRERKGEHLHVFDELKTSGFIRARVDGILCEIEYPPELEKNKKHSIDVVVDRLKVAKGIEQRLAESFETAVQMAEGIAVVSKIDDENDEEMLFSALFACPKCGHSISELEPKLFSFNSPAGACSTCDGLGQKQFFDESKLITDNCLSLGEGAIRGWDRRNIWYFQMLSSLADHYKFKLDIPFKNLSKKHQKIILRGSDDELISFKYINDKGNTYTREIPFEGIIPNMERRYRETESNMVREDLSKFLSSQACPDCAGTRLRKDARFVFVQGISLPQITEMTVTKAVEYFSDLQLSGKRATIADKVLKELQERLKFLEDVGLNYLTLNRSAETLSGRSSEN